MIIVLTSLPITTLGIYGPKKDQLPERMRYLHPGAARAFLAADTDVRLRVSDMLRSAESSLAAVRAGRGAQPPGWSGHNYGLSVDLDVEWTLRRQSWKKSDLDAFMANHGWYCHRRDSKLDHESWHFNHFGTDTTRWRWLKACEGARTTAPGLEAKIQYLYGAQIKLGAHDTQAALKKLGLYSGAIDGITGPLTKEALGAFARAWRLEGKPAAALQRTLAFVAADREVA